MNVYLDQLWALKMPELIIPEWKTRQQIAGVKKVGVENVAQECSSGFNKICNFIAACQVFRSCIFQPCFFDHTKFSTSAFFQSPPPALKVIVQKSRSHGFFVVCG